MNMCGTSFILLNNPQPNELERLFPTCASPASHRSARDSTELAS